MNEKNDVNAIDFGKYRTPELAGRIVDILSIPLAVRRVYVTALVLALLVLATIVILCIFANVSGIAWLAVCAYALWVGLLLGFGLGLIRVAVHMLANVESIMGITIDIAQQASSDVASMRTGQARMPSGRELVEQVHDQVIMPTIETAVSKLLGPVGRPLLWFYRRTIATTVRRLLRSTDDALHDEQKAEALSKGLETALESTAENSDSIQHYFLVAKKQVGTIGRMVRVVLLLPCYIAFLISLAIATIPVLIFRFWFLE